MVPWTRKSTVPIFFASSSNTRINSSPMIFRFCSGSSTPVSYTHLDVYKRQHHRRAEPPVPEGNKNKECIPERQRAGENAVSGERKCDKEMDAEIPELGPGAQPADSSVSGTSYTVSVKEERAIKAGTAFYRHKQLFRLCYTDIYSIDGKARFKPKVREMVLASVNV